MDGARLQSNTSGKSGFGLLAAFWLLVLCCLPLQASEPEQGKASAIPQAPAKFAVLAFRPKPETLARWQPVVDYLNQAHLSRRIELIAYTYQELEAAVAAKAVDFVLTQPGHYIFLTYAQGLYSPLATLVEAEAGFELANFGGVIVSRADRQDIQQLADLRGKKISISNLHSLGGCLMQARELYKMGLNFAEDTQPLETKQSQDKSITAVLKGEADAAFVRSGLIESMAHEGKLDLSSLKVINAQQHAAFPFATSTRLYPEWPLAAMPWANQDSARQVAAAILAMPHGGKEAQAAHIHGFTIPGDYRPVDELMRELREPPFNTPLKLTAHDIWLQYNKVIIGLLAIFGTLLLINIRALQRANRHLQEEKNHTNQQLDRIAAADAQQKVILASMGEGVFGVDMNGLCTFINPVALTMIGWSEEDILDQNPHQIFHHHYESGLHYPTSDCPIFLTVRDGQTRRQEDVFWHKDGHSFQVQLTVTPQVCNGKLVGALAVFMDISERNRITQELNTYRLGLEQRVQERTVELATARRVAETASAAKSTFLANMSHEIRTPMNAILGMAHLMRRDGLPPLQDERLKKIDKATQHLLGVINDILDFSKIEAGKMLIEQTPVDIAAVMEGAIGMLAERSHEKGLQINSELPVFDTPLLGDAIRLTQGLLNFLSNAIKFTASGQINVRAKILSEDAQHLLLRLEVQDSGIGIAPEKLGQLFAAFQQADNSTTRQYGGTGLGLAVTRRLAEMMGGSAGAESAVGIGSTFWFTALLQKGNVSRRMLEIARPAAVAVDLSERRILVAEDEPINQEIMLEILAELGVVVELANDGAAAVERVRRQTFDLVLMDMQMPEMDGVRATEAIRRLPGCSTLPIIATTANAFAEDRARCLAAGMNDFIAKPVDPDELLAMIKRWLPQSPS